jgi:hypothetical protein
MSFYFLKVVSTTNAETSIAQITSPLKSHIQDCLLDISLKLMSNGSWQPK